MSVRRSSASAAPVPTPSAGDAKAPEPDRPGFFRRHKRVAVGLIGAVATIGFVYYVVPRIAGLGPTLRRLRSGDKWWLALGVLLETVSIAGQVVLFRGVFSEPQNRIGRKVSYQITMAGGVATKLLATAGAGGVALTVWALKASGLSAAAVGTGMVCFEILTYGVYMVALALVGFGLWIGVFAGPAPIGLTLVPALFGSAVIIIVVSMLFVEQPVENYLVRRADRSSGRMQRWWRQAAALPRSVRGGLRAALCMVKSRDRSLLGVLAAWAFDIGALWAGFRAFGYAPPGAVLVMGYYVGTLANTLPLPGGIGGVEGGMIGAFLAFGVNGSLAVLAVLAYRTISYWLPTGPGAVAYFQLRHTVGDWRGSDHAAAEASPNSR